MEKKMRVFLAVNFERPLQEELAVIQEEMKKKTRGVRWVKPDLLHLTLKFLGETSSGDIDQFAAPLQKAAGDMEAFQLSLAGLGAFPSPRNPRVVWIGVREGVSQMGLLAGRIEQVFSTLKIKVLNDKDARTATPGRPHLKPAFQPHLTLGRIKRETELHFPAELFQAPLVCKQVSHVDHFYLMKSDLYPSGPVYTPLREFMFSSS